MVLRGLERVKFLSAKVNRNSTFSSLCLCSPGLGMKCKGLWWGLNDLAKGIMLMRLCFPFSSPDSSVSSLSLSFGISLVWGLAQWYFYSALFFQITPPAVLSLHPSCCVLLTPEAFVSFDTSPFPLSSYQALYSSDLLQHSSFAFHLPSLYYTHLILQFLPSPTLPLYSFHIAFFW